MSRLQVGCEALIVGFTKCDRNLGKTVGLDEYKGTLLFDTGEIVEDMWQVSGIDLIWKDGTPQDYCFVQSKHLMPLGDKQTQDELAKESEIENT